MNPSKHPKEIFWERIMDALIIITFLVSMSMLISILWINVHKAEYVPVTQVIGSNG